MNIVTDCGWLNCLYWKDEMHRLALVWKWKGFVRPFFEPRTTLSACAHFLEARGDCGAWGWREGLWIGRRDHPIAGVARIGLIGHFIGRGQLIGRVQGIRCAQFLSLAELGKGASEIAGEAGFIGADEVEAAWVGEGMLT
jgi:hypothetical protein